MILMLTKSTFGKSGAKSAVTGSTFGKSGAKSAVTGSIFGKSGAKNAATGSTFGKSGAKIVFLVYYRIYTHFDSAPLLLDLLHFLKVDNYNLKINFNNI